MAAWISGSVLVRLDGYTLLWSGPSSDSPRLAGVALVMDRLTEKALISWHPIDSRLLTATFQHTVAFVQVIVYAQTEKATATDKDNFFPGP